LGRLPQRMLVVCYAIGRKRTENGMEFMLDVVMKALQAVAVFVYVCLQVL